MPEMCQIYSVKELRRQWVLEHYWPTGQAAENWRAKLTGLIAAQGMCFSDDRAKEIERISKMLDGTYDIDTDGYKLIEMEPEQLKDLIT